MLPKGTFDRQNGMQVYINNSIIEYLDVKTQVKQALFRYSNIRTLSDIDFATDEELLGIFGIGQLSLKQIRKAAIEMRREIYFKTLDEMHKAENDTH